VAPWCHRTAKAGRPSSSAPGTRAALDVHRRRAAWALENLHRPLTLRDLAACESMSTRTFTRRFRDEVGVSAWEWLTRNASSAPAAAGGVGPADRPGRRRGRVRHRGLAAPAPAGRSRRLAQRLPRHFPREVLTRQAGDSSATPRPEVGHLADLSAAASRKVVSSRNTPKEIRNGRRHRQHVHVPRRLRRRPADGVEHVFRWFGNGEVATPTAVEWATS